MNCKDNKKVKNKSTKSSNTYGQNRVGVATALFFHAKKVCAVAIHIHSHNDSTRLLLSSYI